MVCGFPFAQWHKVTFWAGAAAAGAANKVAAKAPAKVERVKVFMSGFLFRRAA